MPKSPISKYPPEFEWMFEKPKEEKTLERVKGQEEAKKTKRTRTKSARKPTYWVFDKLKEAYEEGDMIGSSELQKCIGVTAASIRLFVKNQGLPAYQFGGRRGEYRFKPEEVNAWLLEKRV